MKKTKLNLDIDSQKNYCESQEDKKIGNCIINNYTKNN